MPTTKQHINPLTRAMLLNVLWHHQGGSSQVGQPIREMLGIGEHAPLTDWQVRVASEIEELVRPHPGAQLATGGNYSIERHGNGYALYHGRDDQHHGFNLARITEVDQKRPDLLKLIAYALNAYCAKPIQAPAAKAVPAAFAVPPKAITATLMRDDGGEQPAYCLMAAYRSEDDARAAFAALATLPDAHHDEMTRMVDAAMSVMTNISPPLSRNDCRGVISAALSVIPQAPSGSGGWQVHAERMEKERDYYRTLAENMLAHKHKDVWYWQGDGHDDPKSMANSLAVVIRADQLRGLVAHADAAVATLQHLGYTHQGGMLWKPPLGEAPNFSLVDSLRARIASLEAQLAAQAAPAAVAVPASWADSEDDKPTSRADLERVLDAWNDTTGALPRDSGWRAEVLGMLHDAYDLGAHQSGNEAKALAALRYYNSECTGQEPSLSVFQQMVDEALAAAPAEVQAKPVAVLKGAPYEPTSAMLIAAREIDPALPVDATRAIWWAMWRTAPQAQPADGLDAELLELVRATVAFKKERGSVLQVHIDNMADLLDERDAAMAAAQEGGAQ